MGKYRIGKESMKDMGKEVPKTAKRLPKRGFPIHSPSSLIAANPSHSFLSTFTNRFLTAAIILPNQNTFKACKVTWPPM